MKSILLTLCAVLLAGIASAQEATKPLRALLVTGGCCHDYATQKDLLKSGLEKRANVVVEQLHTDDKGTKFRFADYEKPKWAQGFDVVIHDECTADVKDQAFVDSILAEHKRGVPAVNLHCAMHSYRTGTDEWFKFLGLQSTGHGPQLPIEITYTDPAHPISKGLNGWTTIKEELYNNVKLFETALPLARGKQADKEFVVVWTNDYGKTRVFNTTIGHNNETVGDDRYLDLVTRGLLWACDKLDAGGKPKTGYGR